jgi:hypothetical protein
MITLCEDSLSLSLSLSPPPLSRTSLFRAHKHTSIKVFVVHTHFKKNMRRLFASSIHNSRHVFVFAPYRVVFSHDIDELLSSVEDELQMQAKAVSTLDQFVTTAVVERYSLRKK